MTRSPADVVIIGAGVVGAAIARTLAAYSLELVLVDAAPDVGTGTSKANTAILHTGFDAKPGSLESRLLSRGSGRLREYASAARIPVERTGALLVAWTPDQVAALPLIAENARRNGYLAVRPLAAAELYARSRPSARALSAGSRFRTRASSAPGPRRSPSPPRPSPRASGSRCPPRSPGSCRPEISTSSRLRAGRFGAGGW